MSRVCEADIIAHVQNTNVVKFYSMLKKDIEDEQLCYYQTGVGTYENPGIMSPISLWVAKVLDEAIAWCVAISYVGADPHFCCVHQVPRRARHGWVQLPHGQLSRRRQDLSLRLFAWRLHRSCPCRHAHQDRPPPARQHRASAPLRTNSTRARTPPASPRLLASSSVSAARSRSSSWASGIRWRARA